MVKVIKEEMKQWLVGGIDDLLSLCSCGDENENENKPLQTAEIARHVNMCLMYKFNV